MDWYGQTQQTLASWMNAQRQVMEQWVDTMKQVNTSQGNEWWKKTVETWETTVRRTMDAQESWMTNWFEQMKRVEGLPEEAHTSVEQGETMARRWTEMQRSLWQNWFAFMKQMHPEQLGNTWQGEVQTLFQRWQESAEQMMKLAEDLADETTKHTASEKKNGGKKSK